MTQKRQEGALWVRTLAVGYSPGHRVEQHVHAWGQLVYATAGVMSVRTDGGTWVVPPQRAVWVPTGVEHAIEMSGRVELRTLYLHPELCCRMPSTCRVVAVSPLLRELIVHIVDIGMLDRTVPAHANLTAVLLNLVEALPEGPLALPLPRDPRARRIAELLLARPAEPATLDELAEFVGASKRTIERLFRDETGLTLGRWRQQVRLLAGLRRLAAGEPVTMVALEVGYDSPSAFIAMFRRALGVTPGRYYAQS